MDTLKLYWTAFSTSIQAKFEYRVDFFIGIVTSCMLQVSAFLLLSVIFNQTPDLNGWSKDEVILLFGMTAGALGVSELFFNHIWWVPSYIVMGDLDRLLTYPVNSLYFLLITKPELHSFGNLVTGLVLAYWSLIQLHAPWYSFCLVPLFIISGGLLYTAALVVMSSLSFRFIAPTSNHLMIAHNLLNATRYPVSIYPQLIQWILLVMVPFGSFHYLPAGLLFGKALYPWLPLAAPFLSLLFFVEAGWIWRWGLNKYESTGS
jgi:ABC-2 type transport system permease protein